VANYYEKRKAVASGRQAVGWDGGAAGRRKKQFPKIIAMGNRRIPEQALYWEVRRQAGQLDMLERRSRKKDLRGIGLSWKEAEAATLNRQVRVASECGPVRPNGSRFFVLCFVFY